MKELHDLETYEVSLVPKGANGKRFLILKNTKGENGMKNAQELIDQVTKNVDPEALRNVEKVIKDMDGAHLAPAHEGVHEEPHVDVPLSDKAKAALQAIARIASPMKDEVDGKHLMKVLHAAGYDMKKAAAEIFGNPDGEAHNPDGEPPARERDATELLEKDHMKAIPEEVLSDMKDVLKSGKIKLDLGDDDDDEDDDSDDHDDEDLEKAIQSHMDKAYEEGQKAYKSYMEKLGYRKYPDAEVRMKGMARKDIKQVDVSEEAHEKGEAQSMQKNVLKSLDLSKVDPKVRTALESVFKANEQAIQKAAKLENELKTERDARREKEFIEKASNLKVGAKTDELAKVLKAIDELNPELAGKIESVLKAAGEQIAQGKLYSEVGSSSMGDLPGNDSWAKIETIAEGMVQKSDGKVRKSDAIDAVLQTEEGKRLYNQYMAAKPGMKV